MTKTEYDLRAIMYPAYDTTYNDSEYPGIQTRTHTCIYIYIYITF